MRKQCVPGASPFFARARDEANPPIDNLFAYLGAENLPYHGIGQVLVYRE